MKEENEMVELYNQKYKNGVENEKKGDFCYRNYEYDKSKKFFNIAKDYYQEAFFVAISLYDDKTVSFDERSEKEVRSMNRVQECARKIRIIQKNQMQKSGIEKNN